MCDENPPSYLNRNALSSRAMNTSAEEQRSMIRSESEPVASPLDSDVVMRSRRVAATLMQRLRR